MPIAKACITIALIFYSASAFAWKNGPSGNAATNEPGECTNPPYSTHDWIADHAMSLLPDQEKDWLAPNRAMYLIGTEAPDNSKISEACNAPHTGYNDRGQGHSVEWTADWSAMTNDRPAVRAQEEYDKAVAAYRAGNRSAAAFYLGAMAHYIGDVSAYPHSISFEIHHSPYEAWVQRRTRSFSAGHFENYIRLDRLSRRTPYTAVKKISKATGKGKGKILGARRMDELYPEKKNNQPFKNSVGHSLNTGVNNLADVLHTFYLNVVR